MVSIASRNSKLPFVSVIVCTLDRKKLLRHCIDSLFNIDYPASRFEVIVVDNGSKDGTKAFVEKNFRKVRFILEKRKGLSYARNAGLRNSNSRIIAFTDDDCVVDRGWLKKLVSGFDFPKIGGVGGPVFPLHPERIPKKFFVEAALGFYYSGEETCLVDELVGGNLAIRRDILRKAKFDVKLGRKRSALFCSEDIDFCKTISEKGYRLLYVPDAKVYHNIDLRRANLRYIIKRAFYGGISFYLVERKRKSKGSLIARFLRSIVSGLISFLQKRTCTDLHWLIKCTSAFIASIVLP